MLWTFRQDAPIYLQLLEQIRLKIVSGEFSPGQKLPPVRELAVDAGVNPNTMQRAMTELERTGLVYSQRTAGRFVTEDAAVLETVRHELARARAEDFRKAMRELGYSAGETVELLLREGEE